MPVTIEPGYYYESHEEFLESCADALSRQVGSMNRAVIIDDLISAGYTVTIGIYPQCISADYAGKPWAELVNRDLPISTSPSIGSNHWEALINVLEFASSIAKEKGL